MPESKLFHLIDKAIYDYKMLQSGDKILLAISGGKDSALMLEYMAKRLSRKEGITMQALFVDNGKARFQKELLSVFSSWDVEVKRQYCDLSVGFDKSRKFGCYWCATKRRSCLIDYAMKHGFNKIALAHHADDILETFLMNMTQKGTLSAMKAVVHYDKYPVSIIRPLCYLTEKAIKDYAQSEGYLQYCTTCDCQNKDSSRLVAKKQLSLLTGDNENTKYRILWSLKNSRTSPLL